MLEPRLQTARANDKPADDGPAITVFDGWDFVPIDLTSRPPSDAALGREGRRRLPEGAAPGC
jgi:hypothetical protein